jgi:alpha-1,2-mannosyltransferase
LISLALLFGVVKLCFEPVTRGSVLAITLAFGVALALTPVQENLRFGQLGIALMACCVFDCMLPRTRWPRGALVGVAAAVKLVPAIFVPYLWLTGRRRAAYVAIATFLGCTAIGWIADASDSREFFRHRMFEPTSPKYFSNQSLEGMLQRFIGPWRLIWLPIVAVIVVFGLWQAARASRAGDELRGVAITGLIGVIASPISWVHHIVWIVPVIAAILATGTEKGRRALAFIVAALFIARLPYVGNDEFHGTGFFAAVLEDSYGVLAIVLLAVRRQREHVAVAAVRVDLEQHGRERQRVVADLVGHSHVEVEIGVAALHRIVDCGVRLRIEAGVTLPVELRDFE